MRRFPYPSPLRAEGAMTTTNTPEAMRLEPPFIGTTCRHTGRQCALALQMAAKLRLALEAAQVNAPDFEMTGQTEFGGCGAACPALFRLSPEGVELYCGVSDADALPDLAQFAAALTGTAPAPRLEAPPRAFVISGAAPARHNRLN